MKAIAYHLAAQDAETRVWRRRYASAATHSRVKVRARVISERERRMIAVICATSAVLLAIVPGAIGWADRVMMAADVSMLLLVLGGRS